MDRQGLARLGLVLTLLCAATAAVPGELEEKRRDLSRIQKEYEKTQADLTEYRRQEAALNRDFRQIESHDADARHRADTIRSNIRQAEQRRSQLRNHLGALNLASGFWTTALESELRDYASGLAVREEAWGGASLWEEAFRRAVLLDKAHLIAGLRGYRHMTEAAVEATRHASVALKDQSRRAEAEAVMARQEYERQQAALAEARGRVESAQKRARELEETKQALTQLLSRIGGAARPEHPAAARLELPRNSLPWPVDGRVSRPFGRQRNPDLNTWVIRQGVTFATRPGAAVGAVEAGRVIYAGPFRSYGKVVIVDHGDSFFSIYGELGDILKPKGAPVEAGEAVGTAGGVKSQGAVYLELRRGTEALDPMLWLQRKS